MTRIAKSRASACPDDDDWRLTPTALGRGQPLPNFTAVRSDYVAGGLVAAYQPRFRHDNTEGYTEEQLADLNRHYEVRLAMYSAEDRCRKSVRDYVAQRAQVEFDALNRL